MPVPLILASTTAGAAAMYNYLSGDESYTEKLAAENNKNGITKDIGTVRLLVIGSLALGALYIAARYLR